MSQPTSATARYRAGVKASGGKIIELRLSRSELDVLELLCEQLGVNRRDLIARLVDAEREKQGIPKLEDT